MHTVHTHILLHKGTYDTKRTRYLTTYTSFPFAYSELRTRSRDVTGRIAALPVSSKPPPSNHGLFAHQHRATAHIHALHAFPVQSCKRLQSAVKRFKPMQGAAKCYYWSERYHTTTPSPYALPTTLPPPPPSPAPPPVPLEINASTLAPARRTGETRRRKMGGTLMGTPTPADSACSLCIVSLSTYPFAPPPPPPPPHSAYVRHHRLVCMRVCLHAFLYASISIVERPNYARYVGTASHGRRQAVAS